MTAPLIHGGPGRRVEIVIPVRHIWWIGILVQFYRARGLDPIWIVDASASWAFRLLARRHCPRLALVHPTAPRAETMLAPVIDALDCDWIVRLDGDELPSDALIETIHGLGHDTQHPDFLGSTRAWLRLKDGRIERAHNTIFGPEGQDWQYRILRRSAVEIATEIHTPGFAIDPTRLGYLPGEACLWHFNWICYARHEREAKIAAYDAQKPGAGSDFRQFYLPEEAPPGVHDWQPIHAPGTERILRRIARHRDAVSSRLAVALAGP
ncbi:MAG: hypothetical protein AAGI34_06465 [Pseudomonadota bacterium]